MQLIINSKPDSNVTDFNYHAMSSESILERVLGNSVVNPKENLIYLPKHFWTLYSTGKNAKQGFKVNNKILWANISIVKAMSING